MTDIATGKLSPSKRLNGQAQNPFLMADGQFQYGKNIDIRNDISCVQLSAKVDTRNMTLPESIRCYLPVQNDKLIRFYAMAGSRKYTIGDNTAFSDTIIGTTAQTVTSATVFKEQGTGAAKILAFAITEFYVMDYPVPTTYTAVAYSTIVDQGVTLGTPTALLVYSNSVLLVASGRHLWRYVPIASAELPIGWSLIRSYQEDDEIFGMTLAGNTLKIYINERYLNMKISYIAGSFDVQDGGTIQTVEYENTYGLNVGQIGQQDFVLTRSIDTTQIYFYQIDGYNRQKVLKTLFANGQSNQLQFFTYADLASPGQLPTHNYIMYLPLGDGIRSFGENEAGKYSACLNRQAISAISTGGYVTMCVFGDYLYISIQTDLVLPNSNHKEAKIYLGYRNNGYNTNTGVVIDRIYTNNFSKYKENLALEFAYELDSFSADPGQIAVYIRPNRANRTPTAGRTLVGTITDKTKFRQRFDITVDALKADRNCIEVKFEITIGASTLVSPCVYDYELLYGPIDKP